MWISTITGRLTRDAEMKDGGGQTLCKFSVATNDKVKGEKTTHFIECAIWGKRGDSLSQYLTKGTQVVVSGKMLPREYNGKTYYDLTVDQIDLMGGGQKREQPAANNGESFDEPNF